MMRRRTRGSATAMANAPMQSITTPGAMPMLWLSSHPVVQPTSGALPAACPGIIGAT